MTDWKLRGAFLMDTLIAFFILSVGLFAVVGLFIQISRSGHELDRLEQAVYLAEVEMERLRSLGSEQWAQADLMEENGSEQVNQKGLLYNRVTTVRMRPDLDSTGHVLEAEVRVGWIEKSGNRSIVLVTYYAVDTGLENLR
jgi:Tfp pilus assembly protein PilV